MQRSVKITLLLQGWIGGASTRSGAYTTDYQKDEEIVPDSVFHNHAVGGASALHLPHNPIDA